MSAVVAPIGASDIKSALSRHTSVTNSVTSFKTAPLASSSVSAASVDSLHTVNAAPGTVVSEHGQFVTPATSPYPTSNGTGFSWSKGKGKDTTAGSTGYGASHPIPPRLDTLPPLHPYYTPPSPPPSVSPTDEKNFALYASPQNEDGQHIIVETPSSLTRAEQMVAIELQKTPQPQSTSPRPTPYQAGTHPLQSNGSPTATKHIAESSANGSATRFSRATASEDSASSVNTVMQPAKPPSITLSNSSAPTDQLLHPSSATAGPSRMARRNTTGSAAAVRPTRNMIHAHSHMSVQIGAAQAEPSHGFPTYGEGVTGELESDILKEAELIRAERRAKAQQEVEQAMTAPRRRVGSVDGDGPLVGKIIGEDHVNYVLMYNMLTGIRVAVSRCQAKIKRPLSADDFTASHKYSFDIVGNELTPSARYDFKFKDYAPNVFRELREDIFGLDPSDYLVSLTAKYILSELGSPGKSGSFFYFSRDYRFIIKTLHHGEHKFLRRVLKQYHAHMKENPHSLLSRFYGLHRVKLPRGRKIHFVIMNNLFPPHRDIHETFDLKGSTVGREFPEERAAQNPRAVLKDLNWIHRGRSLELGPEKRELFKEQVRRDVELLKNLGVMDYSLLIGIHNLQRGNRDNLRRNTLKIFEPPLPHRRLASQNKSRQEANAVRRAMRESDPKSLSSHPVAHLPEEDPQENKHIYFYADEGGFQATDECNEAMDTIYYFGIIDICTVWTPLKRIENLWKGMKNDRGKISPVPPIEYGERFVRFMKAIMRGGEGTDAFVEHPPEHLRPDEHLHQE